MYEIDENGELVFKRKVVMTMTEERAALLDKILGTDIHIYTGKS